MAWCVRFAVGLAAAGLSLPGCSIGGGDDGGAGAERSAARASGPCVPARVMRGSPPSWAAPAGVSDTPFVVPAGDAIVGFVFPPAFHAGHPRQRNKILWVVRDRRTGPLVIEARPGAGSGGAPVRVSVPDDSGPGEIYPSAFEVPTAGCWRLALSWGSHRARVDVAGEPARG
jgi:hypothetical protein